MIPSALVLRRCWTFWESVHPNSAIKYVGLIKGPLFLGIIGTLNDPTQINLAAVKFHHLRTGVRSTTPQLHRQQRETMAPAPTKKSKKTAESINSRLALVMKSGKGSFLLSQELWSTQRKRLKN